VSSINLTNKANGFNQKLRSFELYYIPEFTGGKSNHIADRYQYSLDNGSKNAQLGACVGMYDRAYDNNINRHIRH
jgi:hypothetical protein